jgi:hypothetical protein
MPGSTAARSGSSPATGISSDSGGGRGAPARQAYFDGELCGMRADGITSFSMIQLASDADNAVGLVFFLFDLLYLDGEDLTARPLIERKERLAGLRSSTGSFQFGASVQTLNVLKSKFLHQRRAVSLDHPPLWNIVSRGVENARHEPIIVPWRVDDQAVGAWWRVGQCFECYQLSRVLWRRRAGPHHPLDV